MSKGRPEPDQDDMNLEWNIDPDMFRWWVKKDADKTDVTEKGATP